jgi:hypothetical protein
MRYLRLSCSVAALAGAALLIHASAGSAQPGGKPKAAATPAARAALVRRPPIRLLVPLRPSITALTAAQLASLRKGFAQMIAWNSAPHGSANFKRSLVYWANMHAYVGSGCTANNNGLNNPGMSGLSAQSKSTSDENATWCTCQHSPANGNNLSFLTWHRMYLYYFEKVLQAAAGDPTLRLPYWDYETDGHIPAAYRSPTYVLNNQTVPNPLYIANRQAQLNAGTAALTAAVVSTSGAMPATSYAPFNAALEQTPHGAVHCATGVASCPSGYMGYVPTAGNDPIFYSHHANIDRLYECWLKVNQAQRLPTGSTLTASFNFIDGSGALVTRTVSDMLTTAQLHYGYTAGGGCPLILHWPPIIWKELPWKVFPLLGPTRLNRGTTSLPVRLAPELRTRMFAAPRAGAAAVPVRQATLVLEGLHFDEAPGVMFEVALQGPNGKRVPVGVINFFNQTAPHHGEMAAMEQDGRQAFDATAALQALGGAGDAQLVVEPTTGVTGQSTSLAAERLSARANVRFSAARLELR